MTLQRLTRVRIAGFRSLKDVELALRPITVLIGPNGAGKSNLLSALRMPPLMRFESLRRFVGAQGGASKLLRYGPAVTRELEIELAFEGLRSRAEGLASATDKYSARLGYAAGDSLVFLAESVDTGQQLIALRAGDGESSLDDTARQIPAVAHVADDLIGRMRFFHFHDTSFHSPLRQNAVQADADDLRGDGSNLAAFLYRLRTSEAEDSRASWKRIEGWVRMVAPFIKRLEPTLVAPELAQQSAVRLYWTDERDHRFDVHDLSDGTLRAIALIAALGQPSATLPAFITIDEPELGLHPAALTLVASLVESVSSRCQILLATQSPALLDLFPPEDVVVVEQKDGESSFRRLDSEQLSTWLEEYSLSELYDKNVLGGRP